MLALIYAFSFLHKTLPRDLAETFIRKTVSFHQCELLNKLGRQFQKFYKLLI